MKNTPNTEEQEEKEHKLVHNFQVISGGKEPPSTGETWLDRLPIGACFLVRAKNDPMEFNLGLFRLGAKTEKSVVLNSPSASGNLYIDPVAFCNKFRMFEDLGLMITKEEVEQENDSDRVQGDEADTPAEVE